MRDALSAFSRLISPSYKKLFEGIFTTLEAGLSKLGESAGKRTKAISDLDVLIVDASKHFVKKGKNNKLQASDIKRIVDVFINRDSIEKFSQVVSKQTLRDNGYNLNMPRYVDSSIAAQSWDLHATMLGGIPNSEIAQLY